MKPADLSIHRPVAMARLLQALVEHGELTGNEITALLSREKQRGYLDRYLAFGLALGCLQPVAGAEASWFVTPLGLTLAKSTEEIKTLAQLLLLAQPEYRHWCELALARTLLALFKRMPIRPERVEAFLTGELKSFAPAFNAILDWLETKEARPISRLGWQDIAEVIANWEKNLETGQGIPLRAWDKTLLNHTSPSDDDRFNLLRDLWPAYAETPVLLHERYLADEPTAQRLVSCLVLAATRSSEDEHWWSVDISRFRTHHAVDASGFEADLLGLRRRLFDLGLYTCEAEGKLALARPLDWIVNREDWAKALQADAVLMEMPALTCPPWPPPVVQVTVSEGQTVSHSYTVELRERVNWGYPGRETLVTLPSGLLAACYETEETLVLPSAPLLKGAFRLRAICYGSVPIGGSVRQQTRRLPRAELWRLLYAHQPFVHLAMQLGLLIEEDPERLAMRRQSGGCAVSYRGQACGDFLDVARVVLAAWGFRAGRIVSTSEQLFGWLTEIGVIQQRFADNYALTEACYQSFMGKEGMRNYYADQPYRDWLTRFLGEQYE